MAVPADPASATSDEQPRWHAESAGDVVDRLGSGDAGLSTDEAGHRLDVHGPNQLEEEPPPHPLVVLVRQFRSPLIYILLAAAAVTVLLEEYIDAAVIAAVLALNAIIGFTQERKAEGAVRALMGLVVPHAKVVRGGQEWEIDSRELVPGDMVLLEPGSRVPADLRLTWTNSLQIDESLLTGESLPVSKRADTVDHEAPLADRSNMAFTGAVVTSGRGRGVAVATGSGTELGAIAGLIRSEHSMDTPLQRRMARFASIVGIVVGVASVLVFASGVALGGEVEDMFLTAVALAVAAIPEGLPVVFTITLALGVRRMAQRNAIIRRLPAVETLGSTTVIGSDKTGTLTENRMTVRTVWASGRRYELQGADPTSGFALDGVAVDVADHVALGSTLLTGVLANEADAARTSSGIHSTGDPTEVALLVAAMGAAVEPEAVREAHPTFAEIPFESERRYSATVCDVDGHHEVFVKGAPERIIEMCTHMLTSDGPVPIDGDALREVAHDLASDGLRVLAFARRRLPQRLRDADDLDDPDELVLVGMQGMLDPPREGVRDAIATCHGAGIGVVMITGDHAVTARAIAADLGITEPGGQVLTGSDMSKMTDDELQERVSEVRVFARVAPEEKLRIVRAFQGRGDVVAVTGDGVNDAPALKAAEIGVAMGESGTDVAREASDMVLTDDNFVSIAAAVEEGRVTFDNVRKVTFFLVSTGAATIIAITVGVWLQWPLLMLPAQLLWLNLVTNGLQDVALAFEPGEEGVVDRPPRPVREGVLNGRLWSRTVVAGVVMAAGTLVLFRWQLDRANADTDAALTLAQTTALTVMVIYMAFHAGNSRSETRSLFRLNPLSNPFLFAATTLAVGIHVGALYWGPTQFVLRVEPLDLDTWIRIMLLSTTIIAAMEIDKAIRRRAARPSARSRARSAALEGAGR
jgi:magnesium-transporting ATPase (P-type)